MKKPKRARNHTNPLSILKINKVEKFPKNQAIIIDIGSYRGEFVEKYDKIANSQKNFLVLEIRKQFFEYLKEKFSQKENIQVYDGDAGKNLPQMLKDFKEWNYFVEKIFINFPDP